MSLEKQRIFMIEYYQKYPNKKLYGNKNPMYGKTHSESIRKRISINTKLGMTNVIVKEQVRKANLGKKASDKTKYKLRLARLGSKNPRYGIKFSEETRKKMRKSTLKYLRKNGFTIPRIGKHEKQRLNEFEFSNNIKLIRQFEVNGYFIDGYNKKYKLVVEVDEIPKTSEREVRRQREIENELKCKFVRIDEY